MNCKRCGKPLPSEGFLCKHCGTMMDNDQIKIQKENLKQNPLNYQNQFISEKYTGHKQIFEERKEEKNGLGLLLFLFFLLILILFIIGICLFFIK